MDVYYASANLFIHVHFCSKKKTWTLALLVTACLIHVYVIIQFPLYSHSLYTPWQAGRIMVHYRSARSRIKRWLIWATCCGIIAGGLCGFSRDDGVIPLNKNLWSLSFTMAMACFGFIMLSLFYVFIDVWGVWSGAPFRYVGLNSIAVYLVSEVLGDHFPLRWQWHQPDTHEKLLFMNLTAVTCLTLMAYYMYTINFFVRI